MQALPTISVIVPVYNGSRTIQNCLDALLEQDYPADKLEVIVVDNKSQDATLELVSSYKGIKLLQQTEVQNSYASRNFGTAQAEGEILVFTDADCSPAKDWLSRLAAPFADSQVLAVGGAMLDAQAQNLVEKFLSDTSPLSRYHEAPEQYLKPLITANAAVRKVIFEEMGGFQANLYTGSDIDLAWRIQLKYGNCLTYAKDAVIFHHHRSNLKSMFRQYRRHGFGEIFLDALYRRYPGYPRTLGYQLRQIARQSLALLNYIRSFLYRLMKNFLRPDRYYLLQPLFRFVAESGNVWGKLQGLWVTQGMRISPVERLWEDPGG